MKLQQWHYTITFKGSFTCAQKFKLIEKFPNVIHQWMNYRKNKSLIIDYAVEYHKRPDRSNNHTAPHVHGVLYCSSLSRTAAEEIHKFFNKNYGRTQFFLQEDDISQSRWLDYCRKDVSKNNIDYPLYQHWKQVIFTNPSTDNFWEAEDIIKDEI